ncbi:MAG: hypothetical protein ABIG68_10230, partial [Acidobacteriota bacterium]
MPQQGIGTPEDTMADVQTAESSPAAVAAPEITEQKPLESYSDAEYATWLEKGELAKPKTEESAPSTPSEAGEQPKGEAASEPAKETEPQKPKKQDAETRKRQLGAEIQQLLEQRHKLREELAQKGAPKPESPPGQQARPAADRPKRPKIDEFESYEKYEDALDKYSEDLADWKVAGRLDAERAAYAKHMQAERVQQTNQQILTTWQKREAETVKRHPDFREKVAELDIPQNPILDAFVFESDIGPDIVYHLATHPEEA